MYQYPDNSVAKIRSRLKGDAIMTALSMPVGILLGAYTLGDMTDVGPMIAGVWGGLAAFWWIDVRRAFREHG